ncbi:aconitate hydratase AcnA [Lentisalinibacter sediminis]|uniref:aconitate hydratase AcnA n=1 Tax=Lentisalinibacter sediminis TaxID=2992237 RepID=UPI00386D4EC1
MKDSFGARSTLEVGGKQYEIFRLDAVSEGHVARLPYSLKILLENLLRHEDGRDVTREDIQALANWDPEAEPSQEISFTPSRVILQDFTGVPAVVDLAAMRDAVVGLGGKAADINPLSPAELVIDHSVQVDRYGTANALDLNNKIEFQRNKERYSFLRWGQSAFDNFKVVPPNTGIVHQVNLEYLARVVFEKETDGKLSAYPDTLVGTDSHTTMVNGLGVLGWGVGGIEAEAAMLGQPITMLIPQVIGFKLTGRLSEGTTATDLVLTVTEMLREKGVVGKFVEFFGDGLAHLPLADRATIGNMSPEFGSTCAIFPIDGETVRYLELSGREPAHIEMIEAYAKEQGLWREEGEPDGYYTDVLELDLGDVVPSLAGPKRPQDRIPLKNAKTRYREVLGPMVEERGGKGSGKAKVEMEGQEFEMSDGAVLIAAITSCTNTSNPAVMVGAGLLARNARERGLTVKPWVKTSLAPGSKVVTDYLEKCELMDDLDALGFYLVGYGCTTCIGNSGPLKDEIHEAVESSGLIGCSVLSGNRNFEGRIHPLVKMNFLASPPLVVAYAIAGTMDVDIYADPIGEDADGKPVYLKDIWPSQKEIQEMILQNIDSDMFRSSYAEVFAGDENWNGLDVPEGEIYTWDEDSTYVKNPPYFEGMNAEPADIADIGGARVLALLGDSVTTDHISPAGSIAKDSPAAEYLQAQGVEPKDFNSYGSRRGNHEVMMRGTFANIRLRNKLAPGTEGGWTRHQPSGDQMSIYDASLRYREDDVPLVVIAGKEYGTGSSRDWAAKGTLLLGVKAVIAESFERIHRSNLIGMGVLPLQFREGENAESLGLDGTETYDIGGLAKRSGKTVKVTATPADGEPIEFEAIVRIDTPKEQDYYAHGGILHYVLRQLAGSPKAA